MRYPASYRKKTSSRDKTRAFTLVEVLVATAISVILFAGLLLTVYDIGRYSKRVRLLVYTQRETNEAIQVIKQDIMSGSEVKFFNPDIVPFNLLALPEDGVYNDKSIIGGVDWTIPS